MACAVVSTFGPMMYRMPSPVSLRAPLMDSFGSFLSSIDETSIMYFSPPISTPPMSLYILAVTSAQ